MVVAERLSVLSWKQGRMEAMAEEDEGRSEQCK
jgi:hypothetical protein